MQLLPWAKWESLEKKSEGKKMKARERDGPSIVLHSKTLRQKPLRPS